jgi:hypothetical protein
MVDGTRAGRVRPTLTTVLADPLLTRLGDLTVALTADVLDRLGFLWQGALAPRPPGDRRRATGRARISDRRGCGRRDPREGATCAGSLAEAVTAVEVWERHNVL